MRASSRSSAGSAMKALTGTGRALAYESRTCACRHRDVALGLQRGVITPRAELPFAGRVRCETSGNSGCSYLLCRSQVGSTSLEPGWPYRRGHVNLLPKQEAAPQCGWNELGLRPVLREGSIIATERSARRIMHFAYRWVIRVCARAIVLPIIYQPA